MTTPLPTHALGTHASTDEIDSTIHDLIDLHFAGEMSEEDARREISGALYVSGFHQDVARTRTDLSPQGRNDLAELLLTLVTEKVIGNDDNGYSLATGRNHSACGWARQLAKSAMSSEMRNSRRADTRNGTPLDPAGHEFSIIAQSQSSLIVWDAHSAHVDGDVGDLVEQYTTMTKGMRETDRMVVNADTICVGLGVAPAVRPEQMVDRDFVMKALAKDRTLAQRSLRSWTNLVYGTRHDTTGSDIDDRIMVLWDEQSEDSAVEILGKSAEVAHMLAVAAVSPLPRPAKKALQRLKTVAMVGNGSRSKSWRELASALVDSYVASEFEAVSQYATMSVEARAAAITGHKIARGRFGILLERAASHPGAPLGKDVNQILALLGQMAEKILADEPSRNSIRTASSAVA